MTSGRGQRVRESTTDLSETCWPKAHAPGLSQTEYPHRVRPRLLLCASLLLLLPATGCASACKNVKSSRQAFVERKAAHPGPHMTISIPNQEIDRLIAPEVQKLGGTSVKLPSVAGISLGKVGLRVEKVSVRQAPPGKLGFTVRVVLGSGPVRVMTVDLDAVVQPKIDLQAGTVEATLTGKDIAAVRPRLDKQGSKELVDYAWKQLPSAARQLTSRKQLEQVVAGLSDEIMGDAAEVLRRELAGDIGEIASVELDLPDLPLKQIAVTSGPKDVRLAVTSTLPIRAGVPADTTPLEGFHPREVQVRMSGSAAAELGNWAMREGEIPERWGMDGSPDPGGPLVAGLDWAPGPRPLKVHLWATEDDCAHVTLGATPRIEAKGDALELATSDAQIEDVEGSAKVRAGIWFSGLGRQSFEVIEETAAHFDLEIAGQALRTRIHTAELRGNEVVLGLALGSAQKGR